MASLSDAQLEFLRDNPFVGVVTTVRPDGSLHSTVVWVDVEDGDPVFLTTRDRAKFRHLEHNPQVSLLVADPSNTWRWVSVSGTVELSEEKAVPRVDKLVGPGNAYVAAAKALVARDCAIDFHAGPSEIVIVSASGDPGWIAADLIAQAEHDPNARAILLTPSKRLAHAVQTECARQLGDNRTARQALARGGGIVMTRNLQEAIAISQRLAPEHVVCDDERVAAQLTIAGTVFVGGWSAQATVQKAN